MTAGDQLVTQFLGDQSKAKRGWLALRAKADGTGKSWSAFLGRHLESDEGQTLVEAVGTLVHESTSRLKAFRGGSQKDVAQTALGHAAAAHGTALDNAALAWEIREQNNEIIRLLKTLGAK